MTFRVPAMDSRRCARAISSRVSDVPGVHTVEVDFDGRTVRVTGPAEAEAIRGAIAAAGHEVYR